MTMKKPLATLGILVLLSMKVGGAVAQAPQSKPKNILFFGNSLTAGYGVGTERAFPALIQQRVDSLGWPFRVVNAGLSGETSSGGLRRINWVLRRKVDVFVLELGGNDALRGIDLKITRANLAAIIDRVRNKYPKATVLIAGMQVPPNLGQDYAAEFRQMFPQLALAMSSTLIPFLLERVGGIPELNQADRIHPTAAGHRIVAGNVWEILKPLLAQKLRRRPPK